MNAPVIRLRPERSPEQRSDEKLLQACAGGDEVALRILFRRHHDSLERFLCRLLPRDCPERADLIQQIFLTAWTNAHKYQGRSTVQTWLFGIAANQAKRHHRAEGRFRSMLRRFAQQPEKCSSSPEAITSQKQMVDRLEVALEKLPHKLKVTYVLCEIEEVSGAEAAHALGVKPGTIWRRLHEARKLLRTMVVEEASS